MQGQHLYEYAVVRVVPRVEREEFINVGVILYCSGKKFLDVKFELDEKRLLAFPGCPEVTELRDNLRAFELICKGGRAGGAIGMLDLASRFRWLTATRSTVIQSSKTHPGFCNDAAETLEKLFEQLVR